ncbi:MULTISPECIES: hypothetical protein [unclassified Streptomyces]|uniref:hypothetical protein n=1 Tax=unclassified Streptomyces TaxID=2593676 RepID=UPI000CD56EF2|nr:MULTISPECIES: hypothetical protein [unclassified Streptomyces]
MTTLSLRETADAAGLAAFLTRQLRWDKAAVVRLRASGDGVLAAFTRPARFEVLAVRPSRLAEPADLDATVSVGQLLDGIDEAGAGLSVPPPVTGPPWAGVLPPRGAWRRVSDPALGEVRGAAAGVVAEFRSRSEAMPTAHRTRSSLDALAEEIWGRVLPGTALPLRAVHAAHALGFLHDVKAPEASAAAPAPAPAPTAAGGGPAAEAGVRATPTAPVTDVADVADVTAGSVAVLSAGGWLRLRTAHGSIAVRTGSGPGLSLTPVLPVGPA